MKTLRIYLKFGARNLSAGYTYLGSTDEAFWHGYVLHEGITYKSRVPRTS
jgi:hypothetical protein